MKLPGILAILVIVLEVDVLSLCLASTVETPTTATICQDIDPDCPHYGFDYICTKDFLPWSNINCRKFCKLCGNCEDKIKDCSSYGWQYICVGDYIPWSQINCAKYCGFCPGHSTASTTPATTRIHTTITSTTKTETETDTYHAANLCTFENGLCGWVQLRNDDGLDWTVTSSSHHLAGTNPRTDHTTATDVGKYLYTDSSISKDQGRVNLASPVYQENQTLCFEFWDFMSGNGDAVFYVFVLDIVYMEWTEIFQKPAEQSSNWKENKIVIPQDMVPNAFRIVLEAKIDPIHNASIAIDDLYILPGPCTGTMHCSFDDGSLCGWIQLKNDDGFDWDFSNGYAQSGQIGPLGDHTSGSGKYLYINSSAPHRAGDHANIASPVLSANQTFCFEFWDYVYGDGMKNLSVYTLNTVYFEWTKVYSKSGDRSEHWSHNQITIPPIKDSFKIVVEAGFGTNNTGGLAIDDLAISSGRCKSTFGSLPLVG